MKEVNGNEIAPKNYKHVLTCTTPDYTVDQLKQTVLWLFYRKVLKLRRYVLLDQVVQCFTIDGKLKARTVFTFKQRKTNKVFIVNLSRHEPLYFTVNCLNGNIYKSKYCLNIREFEEEFNKFFYRRTPILSPNAGVFGS